MYGGIFIGEITYDNERTVMSLCEKRSIDYTKVILMPG